MLRFSVLLVISACGSPAPPATPSQATSAPVDRATVPLDVLGNRPYVELALKASDGSLRMGRFLVDSGGGGFLLAEPFARSLGLTWGPAEAEEGKQMASVTSPVAAFIGDLPLELDAGRIIVLVGETNLVPRGAPGRADGLLPGHVLARYHVVFDYPKATFTIARSGALPPVGAALPMPVGQGSGFPRTEILVDGVRHGFLLDTGASFTMVSEVLLKTWGAAHPDWPRHPGAYGEAATLGGRTLETLSVAKLQWGDATLAEVGVTSQPEGTFEKWMSSMMAAPIVGSLAGNVLKQFRVDLDYPNQTLYLARP